MKKQNEINPQKKYNIIDPETGELINEILTGDKIVRANSISKLNSTSIINQGEEFVKVFVRPLLKLKSIISKPDTWTLLNLIPYLDFTDGLLKNKDGSCITIEHIMSIMELKRSIVYKTIKNLRDNQIIATVKTGDKTYIAVNPFIFMKGQRMNDTLINVFKDTRWVKEIIED